MKNKGELALRYYESKKCTKVAQKFQTTASFTCSAIENCQFSISLAMLIDDNPSQRFVDKYTQKDSNIHMIVSALSMFLILSSQVAIHIDITLILAYLPDGSSSQLCLQYPSN